MTALRQVRLDVLEKSCRRGASVMLRIPVCDLGIVGSPLVPLSVVLADAESDPVPGPKPRRAPSFGGAACRGAREVVGARRARLAVAL